jgi:hypothetical protein
MFAVARRIPGIDREMRDGGWPRDMLAQLHGKTIAVFGSGAIGARVAQLAQGFGMEVLTPQRGPDAGSEARRPAGCDRERRAVSLRQPDQRRPCPVRTYSPWNPFTPSLSKGALRQLDLHQAAEGDQRLDSTHRAIARGG